jgi:hypothetical protein
MAGDSILGAVADAGKDFVKEVGKQVVGSGAAAGKAVVSQVAGAKTDEQEAAKKAEQVATFNRIKQIEAEMAQIRQGEEQKKGPQITPKAPTDSNKALDTLGKPQNQIDEASRQAVGKAEQGRNFKG